jgi:ABC-type multidrug transport system fused ATPase/permease subunit
VFNLSNGAMTRARHALLPAQQYSSTAVQQFQVTRIRVGIRARHSTWLLAQVVLLIIDFYSCCAVCTMFLVTSKKRPGSIADGLWCLLPLLPLLLLLLLFMLLLLLLLPRRTRMRLKVESLLQQQSVAHQQLQQLHQAAHLLQSQCRRTAARQQQLAAASHDFRRQQRLLEVQRQALEMTVGAALVAAYIAIAASFMHSNLCHCHKCLGNSHPPPVQGPVTNWYQAQFVLEEDKSVVRAACCRCLC